MKAIIVDDDPVSIKVLELHLRKRRDVALLNTFTDPIIALEYLSTQSVDIIFLDVNMPEISGMEFLKSIPTLPFVVLTTSSTEHAVQAYDYNVIDYIVKPLTFERLNRAILKCASKNSPSQPDILFLKTNNQVVKINKYDISYIEADGDYVMLYTGNNKYIINSTMKELEDMLQKDEFSRIHRSYIVSKNKIEKIIDNKVIINNQKLPIGNAYKNEFFSLLKII